MAGLGRAWQPQALPPPAPSLAGALFVCRETRKLPFDCGSPRTGRGARQSGSEWQRGKGGALPAPAASRVRSPPGAAAAAAAGAAAAVLTVRQPGAELSAPAGRAERAQQVAPTRPSGPPGVQPSAECGWEALTAMLSHGARLALWTALSLLQVSGRRRGRGADALHPRREPNSHFTFWSPWLCFGEEGGRIYLSPLGRKKPF